MEVLPAIVRDLPSWLLTQTAVHAHRIVSDGLGKVGAHRSHYRVLAALRDVGPMSQAALGRRTGIYLSDMVATINQLVEAGYVERTPDPADRRRNVITLTTPGRSQLRRLQRQVAQIQDDLLAPLSTKEREQLTRLLVRLLEYHTDNP
ncbi:MAG TPA: MarR family transcriptional regulator [Micromonosporaceae bacterium]|nr:MarR family transcriptional regulator [Micromonosporaceae bacterium]